ncbi:hypothetical protein [Streptomyces sp. WMMB 322]|uniref:hypothetical protein n=1 Tax=Streptomyces sp. WMMB 322 TaxID=1286821 RepID=UPI0006E44EDC|nr:hypothetical protein [Streptomyces sp. WMMB 322]SCK05583.1 hypothetical protein H180DRAFT_00088 [Streptomyces sp. WMMB 322]
MINLARAITTAGVALAVSLVAVPSASAVVREAGRTVARAAAQAHNEPADAGRILAPAGGDLTGSPLPCEVEDSKPETTVAS